MNAFDMAFEEYVFVITRGLNYMSFKSPQMNLKFKCLLMLRLVSWTQIIETSDLCFLGKCFDVTSALLPDF